MAMYDYQKVPQYDYYVPSSFDLAPVTFQDPRRPEAYRRDDRYVDDGYRFNYRLHDNWDPSRHGYMPQEQVVPRDGVAPWWTVDRYMDDGYRFKYRLQDNWDHSRNGHMPQEQVVRRDGVAPWWPGREYPYYGGYVGMYPPWGWVTREDSSEPTTVEMYVPLCCEKCTRKVRKHLKKIKGVKSVDADQWEKKVVVMGKKLQPDVLLRRMQRDKPGSVFWSDRPH